MKWILSLGIAALGAATIWFFTAETPKNTAEKAVETPSVAQSSNDLVQDETETQASAFDRMKKFIQSDSDASMGKKESAEKDSTEAVTSIDEIPEDIKRQMKQMEEEFKITLRDKMITDWNMNERQYDKFVEISDSVTKEVEKMTSEVRKQIASEDNEISEAAEEKWEDSILSINERYENSLKELFGKEKFQQFMSFRDEFAMKMQEEYGSAGLDSDLLESE